MLLLSKHSSCTTTQKSACSFQTEHEPGFVWGFEEEHIELNTLGLKTKVFIADWSDGQNLQTGFLKNWNELRQQ